ncbi:methenyltetrahydromethanopterin cyclohydrolase [bacterium]|nr:methenyltetrahydromethanopterin cyclohydrolase [bacterium]
MTSSLNQNAATVVSAISDAATLARLGIVASTTTNGACVFDTGINARGGIDAGRLLAELCFSGLGTTQIGVDVDGNPSVQVVTDAPVAACLQSQYAGWKISVDKYFAMGSGPMRALAAREELFEKLPIDEQSDVAVGVLEAGQLPDDSVTSYIAERCGISPEKLTLLVAPTASLAGTIQVVARSVETAMHKLFELGFDVRRVRSGFGTAPLPPVAKDDLAGIGRTNDAILYGGRVTLWVDGDDDSLKEIGPQVPSSAAECHGRPFLQIFKEAGYDFYRIDPLLFSPAEITFHNLETGNAFRFGQREPDVLRESFGV